MSEKRLLRFADLKALSIARNRMTLKRWMETEGFPRSMKLGPNSESEVYEWLAGRPRAGKKGK